MEMIFRTCVRKDAILNSALKTDFDYYFDRALEEMDVVDTSTTQNRSMEVDLQSRAEGLCSF